MRVATDNDIVSKLSDQEVLRNYCTFAGMHRALTAHFLLAALTQDPNQRRSVALELAANFVAALEDVATWYFVLREWRQSEETLFDLIDRIQVTDSEGQRYSTQAAVANVSHWTIADLRREFGLPSDKSLEDAGWSEDAINTHLNGLREALVRLKSGLELRLEDEGILRTSCNKIKHGLLAIAATENSTMGVSVMIPSRRGPRGPSGKRKINTGWIACDDTGLRRLAKNAIIVSEALWAVLNLVYVFRFDPEWRLPHWPVPKVS